MSTNTTLVLHSSDSGDFKPHPEGIWPAICLDVIDLGMIWVEFQGQRKLVRKLKLIWETECVGDDGKRCLITKNFTASLHPKAKLADFLGKWRGRPVAVGESVDLAKLVGACCTLVISHQQNLTGKTYASIDAVSKPTRKVAASGTYDAAAMRQRIADWLAKRPAGAGNPNAESRNPNAGRTGSGGYASGASTSPQRAEGAEDDVPWGNAPGGGAQRTDAGEGARATTGAGPAAATVDEDVGF